MNKLYTQYRKKQFAVLAVNTDQRQDVIKAKRFLLKNSITFPSVYDERGDVKTKYQITSIPRLFLFDQKGKLIFEAKGFKDISEIENEIKKLIE
jgi:thioredoxin-related protein